MLYRTGVAVVLLYGVLYIVGGTLLDATIRVAIRRAMPAK